MHSKVLMVHLSSSFGGTLEEVVLHWSTSTVNEPSNVSHKKFAVNAKMMASTGHGDVLF